MKCWLESSEASISSWTACYNAMNRFTDCLVISKFLCLLYIESELAWYTNFVNCCLRPYGCQGKGGEGISWESDCVFFWSFIMSVHICAVKGDIIFFAVGA